ncbi:hypothetical protein N331_06614, partial [Merops nubicus]
ESDVFEIVLPITVLLLSDDDFLQDEAEEQGALVPRQEEEDAQEVDLNISNSPKSDVTAPSDSDILSVGEENKTASNNDNVQEYSEGKGVAESVCESTESSLNDQCDVDKDQ